MITRYSMPGLGLLQVRLSSGLHSSVVLYDKRAWNPLFKTRHNTQCYFFLSAHSYTNSSLGPWGTPQCDVWEAGSWPPMQLRSLWHQPLPSHHWWLDGTASPCDHWWKPSRPCHTRTTLRQRSEWLDGWIRKTFKLFLYIFVYNHWNWHLVIQ